jgi:hypothetical protein
MNNSLVVMVAVVFAGYGVFRSLQYELHMKNRHLNYREQE